MSDTIHTRTALITGASDGLSGEQFAHPAVT